MLSTLLVMSALSLSPDRPLDFGPWPNPWTTLDTGLELVLAVGIAADVGQSIWAIHHLGGMEANLLLSKHPSDASYIFAGSASLVAHAAIAYILPTPFREAWQSVWIVFEGINIATNGYPGPKIGLHFQF